MIAESLAEPTHNRKQSFYARHQTTIILASCMLLGLMLRIALAGRSGLWRDEAQFLWIVRIPSLPAMLDFLWHHESHPPLFYILMRVWLSWFGDSEVAALALPVLLGVFLIPVTHRVGDRVFSPQTGLIAAIFVAVSPMLAHYSGMVRPYSLLPLLCLLSVYGLWDGLRGRRARPWVFYVIATLAMLLTHNWAWIVLAAQWILVACLLAWPSERPARPLLVAWALAQFALLAAYSPWLPVLLYQSRHAGYDAFPWNLLDVFTYFTETVVSLPVQAAIPVCIMLIVTAAWRAAQRSTTILPKNERRRSALLLFIGIPLLAFGVANVLSTKTFLSGARRRSTITTRWVTPRAFTRTTSAEVRSITTT
ncbi:MAG: glycosyltransferase family 39 protein [Isosphaeraceae bacterium]